MQYDRVVIGYHGCKQEVAEQLLAGTPFESSENDYDWLGKGIYFWEYGPDRALRFASQQKQRKRWNDEPSIVGAVLQLGRCFDLLDTRFTEEVARGFVRFRRVVESQHQALPANQGQTQEKKLRALDCAVLNWYLGEAETLGTVYQSVRGGFVEGGEAFPGAGFMKETHIQIAVRDPACILGVFRPGAWR